MPMPTSPRARLGGFRAELHACFTRRADALLELGDALLCAQAFSALPHLSLEPVCRRGWGSVDDALASGRVDTERLRDLLAGCLPAADPLVFAVDVTTWPRCDAECSPERGDSYHPRGIRPASRSSPAGPTNGSPSSALTATPGPPRWMPCGCTRWRTPTRPPQPRSARCSGAWAPTGRCPCSCSTPATTPPSCLWSWPTLAWRCWRGGAQTAALRRPTATPARGDRAAAPPRRQVQLRRPGHLADPDRHPGLSGRPGRHRDRGRLGGAASQAAAPSRPRQPRSPADRARHHRARPVERVPARTRPPKVLWLWWAGCGELDLDLAWRASSRRFDLEHTAWPAPSPPISGCRGSGPDPSRACHPTGCAAGFRGCCARSARRRLRQTPSDAPQAGPRAEPPGPPPATRRSRSPPRSQGRSRPRPPRPPDRPSPPSTPAHLGRRPAQRAHRVKSQAKSLRQ
jgi:hypothetical protein